MDSIKKTEEANALKKEATKEETGKG